MRNALYFFLFFISLCFPLAACKGYHKPVLPHVVLPAAHPAMSTTSVMVADFLDQDEVNAVDDILYNLADQIPILSSPKDFKFEIPHSFPKKSRNVCNAVLTYAIAQAEQNARVSQRLRLLKRILLWAQARASRNRYGSEGLQLYTQETLIAAINQHIAEELITFKEHIERYKKDANPWQTARELL